MPSSRSSRLSRGYDASFDISSDEEADLHVGVSCDAFSGKMDYSFVQLTSKVDRKTLSPNETTESFISPGESLPTELGSSDSIPTSSSSDGREEEQRKCKQGASIMMTAFAKELPSLHAAILAKEHHMGLGNPCECGSVNAKYRCRSCFQSNLRCQVCIRNDHGLSPWHHIEEWLGTHFRRASLASLGFRLLLGHHGKRCANRGPVSAPRNMIIVHTNGFHHIPVEFCACTGSSSSFYQLVDADLFPATLEKPETAFTFELLDTFQKLSLRSKINAYDYHRALQEMTDAACVRDVPNRYHEFTRIYRLWDHMSLVRRSGQCHDFDDILPHRRKGSVTVRCPACPEVHFNVDKNVIEFAGEDEAHKYTLFLSADGNFKLQRKNKRGDPDDVSLNNGRGYFVAASPYAVYLEHTKEECDEDCICAHLRALKFRNVMRFKKADVSGVIIIQCARHGFYQPQGMADLRRGEGHTDYVLAYSLADAGDQRWIMLIYDIFCSYYKKLNVRFEQWFPDMLPLLRKIRGAIPKVHIKNHKCDCQYCWALNYIPYSGETSGEGIEATHSEQNGAAASTKEQNRGHRHDSLDSVVNYWNWTKFHSMGSLLYRLFIRCLDTLKIREKQFFDFTACFSPALIEKWETVDDAPKIINNKVHSVHRPNFAKGPPTQAGVREELLLEECARKLAGVGGEGVTEAVATALDIERHQLNLRIMSKKQGLTDADQRKILLARLHLRENLDEWRTLQLSIFPKLLPEFEAKVSNAIYEANPEDEDLLLPSDFSESHRRYLGLELAEKAERELRKGRAHEHLHEVRTAIKTYNHHIALKAKEVRSQRHITRARNIINGLISDIRKPAFHYNNTRQALLNLGHPPDDAVLRELREADLWAKNTALPAKLGDSRKVDPWLFHVACPSSVSPTERQNFQHEMDRVKYFRDRSLRNRAREEREILEEEFKRTIRSYSTLKSAWLEQASKYSNPGKRAYAHKQAAMLERLQLECQTFQEMALRKASSYDKWLQETRDQG
ncbi:hypothetical protein CVT26_016198 [Gymnopilus dilepis]|uniref:CxC2-like cysteine cluster KDZ transposase-associated domain-containing protein n=1 Tax=Gymnopilus dilepis TaxID=231916 RepID=A0A409XYY7_9AGAR|nr:hypothetical protein CVT26_016198 [Gymnopilus dilepis]